MWNTGDERDLPSQEKADAIVSLGEILVQLLVSLDRAYGYLYRLGLVPVSPYVALVRP